MSMRSSAGSMLTRAELRHRSGSLTVVALLVALVTAALLSAIAGARRTSTLVDHFRATTAAADLWYQSNDDASAETMLAAALGDAAVQRAGLRFLTNVQPIDGSADLAVMSDPSDRFASRIERPHVLEGRMPRLDAPDEILLNEAAARISHLHVGDHLRVQTFSTDDLDKLGGGSFPGYNGPRLTLEVVGIGRMPDDLAPNLRRTSPYAVGSPAFLPAHDNLGTWPPALGIQLQPGASHRELDRTMARIQQGSSPSEGESSGGFYVSAVTASDVYLDAMRTSTRSLALGLVVFAVVALAAGALAIGQAAQRHLAASVVPARTLSALGMTRSEIAWARSRPLGLATAIGALLGALGAVLASPLLPIGLVRRAELHRGMWIDPLVLVVGVVVVISAIWGLSFVAAWRSAVASAAPNVPRRRPLLARLSSAARSPALATGLRLAGDRGHGVRSVPIRSSMLGVALAVVGMAGMGVIATSYHALASTPTHWGIPWSSLPDSRSDITADKALSSLNHDRRVTAAGMYVTTSFILNGHITTVSAIRTTKGHMQLTTLQGRLPRSPTEIALGGETARQLGVSIGETVELTPQDGGTPIPLTVVGTVVLPATDNEYAVNVGAAATAEGIDRFGDSQDTSASIAIRFPPGAEPREVERALAKDHDWLQFNLFTEPHPPSTISGLADSRAVASALAVFLSALAAAGMLHVLALTAVRRRRDFGVLRALGLRSSQVRGAIVIEAFTIAAVGVVVGAPVGFFAGRAVWKGLVAHMGAVSDTHWPVSATVVSLGTAVVVVALLSLWPARNAARPSPAMSLRDE